jgi:hypothetical protein
MRGGRLHSTEPPSSGVGAQVQNRRNLVILMGRDEGLLSTLNGGNVILAVTAAVDPKPTFARTFKGRPDVKSTIIVPNEAAIIS